MCQGDFSAWRWAHESNYGCRPTLFYSPKTLKCFTRNNELYSDVAGWKSGCAKLMIFCFWSLADWETSGLGSVLWSCFTVVGKNNNTRTYIICYICHLFIRQLVAAETVMAPRAVQARACCSFVVITALRSIGAKVFFKARNEKRTKLKWKHVGVVVVFTTLLKAVVEYLVLSLSKNNVWNLKPVCGQTQQCLSNINKILMCYQAVKEHNTCIRL